MTAPTPDRVEQHLGCVPERFQAMPEYQGIIRLARELQSDLAAAQSERQRLVAANEHWHIRVTQEKQLREQAEQDLAAAQEARQAAEAESSKWQNSFHAMCERAQVAEERAAQNARDAEKLRRYRAFLIRFDDTDRPDELFVGEGAEDAAMRRWGHISVSWNAHLFRKIRGNADATDWHAKPNAAIAGEPK